MPTARPFTDPPSSCERAAPELLQCQQRNDREEINSLILAAAESQQLQIRPAPLRPARGSVQALI